MTLRDEFERLGVPRHVLAQIIWEDVEDAERTAGEVCALARRILPDHCADKIAESFPSQGPRQTQARPDYRPAELQLVG